MDHRNYPGADRGGVSHAAMAQKLADSDRPIGRREHFDPVDATDDNRPVGDLSLEELIQRVSRMTSSNGRRTTDGFSTTARRPADIDDGRVMKDRAEPRVASPMERIMGQLQSQHRDTIEITHKLREHADRMFGATEESRAACLPMPEASNAYEAVLYQLDAMAHTLGALALEAGRNTAVA